MAGECNLLVERLDYHFGAVNATRMAPMHDDQFGCSEAKKQVFSPTNYVMKKRLGVGVFGEVFLGTSSIGENLVFKRLSKRNPNFRWKFVLAEIRAGVVLQHQGIVAFRTHFETQNHYYLVFDHFDALDLYTYMEMRDFRPLDPADAKNIFRQLADSLLFCEQRGISHRDLKLENILMDNRFKTKLIDFGLCSRERGKIAHDYVGSVEYAAPEVLQQHPYCGCKADVHSLGVVFYCLLVGNFPFFSTERMDALRLGQRSPIPWPEELDIPEQAKDLLCGMLEHDPNIRMSMEGVVHHPWLLPNKNHPVKESYNP
jgi:serine/threonine protein kinase